MPQIGIVDWEDVPTRAEHYLCKDWFEANGIKAVLADPAIVSRLQATGQVVVPGSAAEFAASIDKQRATVAELAKVLGIKAAQ